MQKQSILCVDDDLDLQVVLAQYLESDGYQVTAAHTGQQMTDSIAENQYDVVLLDLTLPDAQGLTLVSAIRSKVKTPIIIVSGKTDTTEKIIGLEMGADDYITKPFEMRELSARIRAVIRRSMPEADVVTDTPKQDEKLVFENMSLDITQYQAYNAAGESFNLTTGEFKLLEALARKNNKVVSREHLYDQTREEGYDTYDRAIDIQIGRIRKKIGDDAKPPKLIKTIRGVGYMLCAQVSQDS